MPATERRGATFTNPLAGVTLGDPFVLRWRGRFYLYGTNDGPPLADGRQIPAYQSEDLIHWEPIGGVLIPTDPGVDHWAPEVLAWNGRFFMVVSFGDVVHRGHALWVAVSDSPAGPFRLEQRLSNPSETFSIDGAWLLDDDGKLFLFRCLDFVEEGDPPHGTGIVVQAMSDPFTPIGPAATVLRAHSPWHLFESPRDMPLYGNRRFREWTTIEGPAPIRRAGRVFCGYSGGNFMRDYGTGEASADHPLGPYEDLRGREGPLFGTTPGLVEGPGHFSVIRPDLISDWIVLHGRIPGESARRVWLCPAQWSSDGVEVGPLTDKPQPAPTLPAFSRRSDGPGQEAPWWTAESGNWALVDGELRHSSPAGMEGTARIDAIPSLDSGWVLEIYLRSLNSRGVEAGLFLHSGEASLKITLRPWEGKGLIRMGTGEVTEFGLPTLGNEPFAACRHHSLELRSVPGAMMLKIDSVRVGDIDYESNPLAQLSLQAKGDVAFDAISISVAS